MYYNLSHPQKRIWYTEKIYDYSNMHNLGGCLKIRGDIDFEVLREAINIIIEKNDGLRLRFCEKDGEPYQYIKDYEKEEVEFFDFSKYEDSYKEFQGWSEKVIRKKFLIEESKMYYFSVFKLNDEECGVMLSIHHIISDGWSINIIQKQLCEIYKRLLNDKRIDDISQYSYIEYLEKEKKYLNSERFEKNKLFWNEKFSNLSESFLYSGKNDVSGKRKTFDINAELSSEIKDYLEKKGWSLNTFFISTMLIYLNKLTGERDIVVGTPVLNRSGKKDKNTIGIFTSTMPFRMYMEKNITLVNFIEKVNSDLRAYYYNQKYPYNLLLSDLELRKKEYDGLFHVAVNYYNTKNEEQLNGYPVEIEEYYSGNQSYSLQLIVKEWSGENRITLSFDYKEEEYTSNKILDMYKYIMNIACSIVKDDEQTIEDTAMVDIREYNQRIFDFNSTEAKYPRDKTIVTLFEEQVLKTPNKIAVNFEDEEITYKQLHKKVKLIARGLQQKGITVGSKVGIMAKHSIELISAILGIMKSGAAYVPIDPKYPVERIKYMLNDSGAAILLTNISNTSEIDFQGETIQISHCEMKSENSEDSKKCKEDAEPSDLAYIIYTSGSTGKPKGVMIEHQGLVNYIWWAKEKYMDENDTFAFYSSISFDLTVTSIFAPLISGNKIVVYYDDGNDFILYKILEENKVSVIKLTPSHLTLLKDRDNKKSSIKKFIVGGENLKTNLAKEICESFGTNTKIFNEYGPTETVVGCMIHEYNYVTDKSQSVPIGVPADNVQVYILDENLKVTPTDGIGDIYVSGDGVARGYINREQLSKDRFIDNPFIHGKKMYKTGDRGKYLIDGKIEYVGRADNQVKIRGHRIELGEIEGYLLENDFIREAVVVDRENKKGDKVLYAYIISDKEFEDKELKKWLAGFLHKSMIPSQFVYVKEFPLTPNGKVDTNNLPKVKEVEKVFVATRNYMEEQLIDVMKEILDIENISMNDNFYQLGGDSIKAIQITSKLKSKGLEIKVKDILDKDVIEEIAASVEVVNEVKVDQGLQNGKVKNTPIIQWFLSQNFNDRNYYNQSVLLECTEKIDTDIIERALKILVDHHDSLRLNFDEVDNCMFFNTDKVGKKVIVDEYDLSVYSSHDQKEKINQIGIEVKGSFNIKEDLLIKLVSFKLAENRQAILFTAHHLIVDGVSWRVLLEDFGFLIESMKRDVEAQLPLKTHSFKEWADTLYRYEKGINEEDRDYWSNLNKSDFTIPSDYDLGPNDIKSTLILTAEIDEETTDIILRKTNEIYGVKANETLITALSMALRDVTLSTDILIELERHGREDIDEKIDVSRTIGWFTSMYPAHISIEGEDIDCNLKSIKEQLRSIPKKGFDFSVIRYISNHTKTYDNSAIRFNYLGEFDSSINSEIFKVSNMSSGKDVGENNHRTTQVEINVLIVEKKFKIEMSYSKNKFKEETMKEILNKFHERIYEIANYCCSKEKKEYTPSDFEAVDISQSDLDILFE